jgi:hypothetical protein
VCLQARFSEHPDVQGDHKSVFADVDEATGGN